MEAALFHQLLFCAVNIATFLVAIESNDLLSVTFCASMAGMTNVLLPSALYCRLSDNLTWNLYSIGDDFFNFTWYRLRIRQQKLFLLPIERSQGELRLKGLGIVECSLRVFSSVNIMICVILFDGNIQTYCIVVFRIFTDNSNGLLVFSSHAKLLTL